MPELLFWINAFIPKTVTGYTRVLQGGKHVQKTAVPLPGVACTWPGNTFKAWDAGYLTDQRGFDESFGASHRRRSWIKIDTDKMSKTDAGHTSSGTTEVHLDTGEEIDFAVADMSRCVWSELGKYMWIVPGLINLNKKGSNEDLLVSKSRPKGSITFALEAAAGDPLVGMAADIDFSGVLTVSKDENSSIFIDYEGLIDAFPAYDCYVRYMDVTKTVFTNFPPAGNTVTNLLGVCNRPISGKVSYEFTHAIRRLTPAKK